MRYITTHTHTHTQFPLGDLKNWIKYCSHLYNNNNRLKIRRNYKFLTFLKARRKLRAEGNTAPKSKERLALAGRYQT